MNMLNPNWLFLFLALSIFTINAKLLIFTYAYNRPDFIALQHQTFERFLQDEYDFVVFNDAIQQNHYLAIHAICHELNIQCIDIPQEIHKRPYLNRPLKGSFKFYNQPSVRNSNVVQYSLDTLGFAHDDILILIDSDMFLIKEFNVTSFMQGYQMAGFYKPCCDYNTSCRHIAKGGKPSTYLWIGLVFIDMDHLKRKTAINFNCGAIKGSELDAGGFTTLFLDTLHADQIRSIDRVCLKNLICQPCSNSQAKWCEHNTSALQKLEFDNTTVTFIQKIPLLHSSNKHRNSEFFLNGTFLHYRAGSNHNKVSQVFCTNKTKALNNYINKILIP